jgi:hypothetical protein
MMERANVSSQLLNLILAERILKGRHSVLAIGNDLRELRIRQLLHSRRTKVWNIHSVSDCRAPSIWAVAHGAFRPEGCNAAGGVLWTCIGSRDQGDKEREAGKKHHQKYRGKHYVSFRLFFSHRDKSAFQ